MVGTVTMRHVLVSLVVRGPAGTGQADFFLDTGFAGFMTLPPDDVRQLGLTYIGPQFATLAEGSRVLLDVYRLAVLWNNVERSIEILEMDGPPLIGMALLDGSNIHIEAVEGGFVSIEQL